MATLILAIENSIPIDRIIYCDIKFSPDISGEHPVMAAWIPAAEKRSHDLFGISVEHIYSGVSFYEQFYTKKKRSGTKHFGDIYGFPYIISAWCNRVLKTDAVSRYLRQFGKQPVTQFVGIAYDEPKRWLRMNSKQTLLRKYRSLSSNTALPNKTPFRFAKNTGYSRRYMILTEFTAAAAGFAQSKAWPTYSAYGKTIRTFTVPCSLWKKTAIPLSNRMKTYLT